MATGQMDLFGGVKLAEPEPTTTVKLGRKLSRYHYARNEGKP